MAIIAQLSPITVCSAVARDNAISDADGIA
jgi:hypothetical protein